MQKKDTTVHNKASVIAGIIYCRKNTAQITIRTGRCPNLHTYRKMPNSFEIDFSTERFQYKRFQYGKRSHMYIQTESTQYLSCNAQIVPNLATLLKSLSQKGVQQGLGLGILPYSGGRVLGSRRDGAIGPAPRSDQQPRLPSCASNRWTSIANATDRHHILREIRSQKRYGGAENETS